MKRLVIYFLSLVLSLCLIFPVVNILQASSQHQLKQLNQSLLFNMDPISKRVGWFFSRLGISIIPLDVVVGSEGWLYIGDKYEQTRSIDRRPAVALDFAMGEEIDRATRAWDAYLKHYGVKIFKIMVAPNKATAYPEYLPVWAKPYSPNATDAFFVGVGKENHIDLRVPIHEAKKQNTEVLYYKTDTHWNALGAALAFRAFAENVAIAAPEIRWPSAAYYEVIRTDTVNGGDLAKFLRVQNLMTESKPVMRADSPVVTTQIDWDSGSIVREGGNPEVIAPTKPLLVKSVGSLNNKRVLWLRDSFGYAMSPLMSTTFSNVLQLHWHDGLMPGGRMAELVERWKPDYVFLTVAERVSRSSEFMSFPPPVVTKNQFAFAAEVKTHLLRLNHLIRSKEPQKFLINGEDPYIDFALDKPADTHRSRYLNVEIFCEDRSQRIPIQLFWMEKGRTEYDEAHSYRITIPTGNVLVDLFTVPRWLDSKSIQRVRFDVDPSKSCSEFQLKRLAIGRSHTQGS